MNECDKEKALLGKACIQCPFIYLCEFILHGPGHGRDGIAYFVHFTIVSHPREHGEYVS